MKTLLSISISLALITAGFSQTNTPPKVKENGSVLIAITLGVLAVGTWAVIYVWKKTPGPDTVVRLVLEKSYDHGTWTPVATNSVALHGMDPIEVFRDQMTDSVAFYRARMVN